MSNPRYIIIRASNVQLLMRDVDPKLADGVWRCAGGPVWDADGRQWCQAITRAEKPPEPRGKEVKLRGM